MILLGQIGKPKLNLCDFVKASMASLEPGRIVLVGEQFILFERWSRNTMQIGTTAVGVICTTFLLHFEFQKSVISKRNPALLILLPFFIGLCESLPPDKGYVVFMDNFSTNLKLLRALRHVGIGGCVTSRVARDPWVLHEIK